jgi:hypothetical protein
MKEVGGLRNGGGAALDCCCCCYCFFPFFFFAVVMRLKTCGFYSRRRVCARVYIVLFCATGGGALA